MRGVLLREPVLGVGWSGVGGASLHYKSMHFAKTKQKQTRLLKGFVFTSLWKRVDKCAAEGRAVRQGETCWTYTGLVRSTHSGFCECNWRALDALGGPGNINLQRLQALLTGKALQTPYVCSRISFRFSWELLIKAQFYTLRRLQSKSRLEG